MNSVEMSANMYRFATSFGKHSISMSIRNSVIEIKRLPFNEAYSKCYFEIVSVNGYSEYQSEVYKTLPNCFKIPQRLKDGTHFLCVCFLSPYGVDSYYSLFDGRVNGIPFRNQSGHIEFIPSSILDINNSFLITLGNKFKNGDLMYGLKPSHMIQSTDSEIKGLAIELTRNSADTISKIKEIYYYVSRTLHYDSKALDTGAFCYTGQTAYEALKYNRCVCQGFANLTVAMCRALGIPSYSIVAYIKPQNSQWEDLENNYRQICDPHQIAIAWANCFDRWVIMDPTFDNDHFYDINGYDEQRWGNGLPYTYFDTTTEFISYTHRFEEILDF